MVNKVLFTAAAIVVGMICGPGDARADVQTVSVVSVGGQGSNIFVLFSSNVGTDQGCPGKRLILSEGVLDAATTSRFYASMMMAFATGTRVTLSVSSCYGSYPALGAADWWFVPQEG